MLKNRQIDDSLKNAHDKKMENLNDEFNKMNVEVTTARNKFSKNEGDMHTELKNLYAKLEEKTKMSEKMKSILTHIVKLKEVKATKQKETSLQTEGRLKTLVDECKKSEMILNNKNKTQSKHDAKIKELQEQRSMIENKLESSSTRQSVAAKDEHVTKAINTNSLFSKKVCT